MPLPLYTMGQNQFDTSPLENALWKYAQHQEQQRQNAFRQQQIDMDRTRLGFEGERLGFERDRQPLSMDMLRAQIEQAKAAAALTPLQRQQMLAQTGMTNAHADLFRAQARAAGQKDEMDAAVLKMLGLGGGGPAPAPDPSPVRPQSFAPPAAPNQTPIRPVADTGPQPAGDPMLIPTQAAQPTQPAQQQPADPIVQTPAGPMPASKAKAFGFLLAYKGRGDAGRMLTEAADPSKLPKTVVDDVAKEEIKNTDLMGRLAQIQRGFDPKFLTYENQAKQYGISWLDKFDATRANLPPAELETHARYSAFKRDVTENLNRYIKEITGAAMGVEEAKRIISSMPNMEDAPTQFKAKLDATVRASQLALARQRFLRTNGLNGQPWQGTPEDAAREMPLERFGGVIRNDTQKLLQQLKSQHPNAAPEQINGAVRAIIRQKYGIDA